VTERPERIRHAGAKGFGLDGDPVGEILVVKPPRGDRIP
jgi:hypothetical protein